MENKEARAILVEVATKVVGAWPPYRMEDGTEVRPTVHEGGLTYPRPPWAAAEAAALEEAEEWSSRAGIIDRQRLFGDIWSRYMDIPQEDPEKMLKEARLRVGVFRGLTRGYRIKLSQHFPMAGTLHLVLSGGDPFTSSIPLE